jgi:hypothetical protein
VIVPDVPDVPLLMLYPAGDALQLNILRLSNSCASSAAL